MHSKSMDDAFLAAIGAVTVEFATLESQLDSALALLLVGNNLEHQALASIVTAELSFKACVHLFGSLHRHRFPDQDDTDLKALCAEVSAAADARNVIAHSTWAPAEEGKVLRIKTTSKGLLKRQFERLTVSDIQKIAASTHRAAEHVLNFSLRSLGISPPGYPPLTL